ncbi:MAG: GlyGly-CTERM sorting domain-containing protein [Pseudomonadota bacterium]
MPLHLPSTSRHALKTGVLLSFLGLSSLALLSNASTPPSNDVMAPTTVGQVVVAEWTGTITAGAAGASNSCPPGPASDSHTINLSVPDGTYDSVNITAAFHIEWDDDGQDMVLTVNQGTTAVGSSDGGDPQENVATSNPTSGAFTALSCAFLATANTPYRGKLTLTATSKTGGGAPVMLDPEAGPGNASGTPPRFQLYAPDYAKDGIGMFGGEATLDVNWKTGSIFYLGFLETLRLKLDHATSPAKEEWVKTQTIASNKVTSDPILVGDRDTGRIFTMQLLLGPGTSGLDYTDDDGESFTPGMAGSLLRSGADHQAMDVGPYPADFALPHPMYPNAVYYCSQDIALAYCSRSDDGAVTFGPSTPIYTQGNCNGLHGHVKVARDGTVYVPNSTCTELGGGVGILSNRPAAIVSEDAGMTWEVRFIGDGLASGGGADPSIGSADDGTVYYAYTDENFNLRMTKSVDKGVTWTDNVNIGALAGITKAEFPAVVAGDPDRAAVAFFGSTLQSDADPEAATGYPGVWHLYLATTYDGGKTYHVVNLTPNDPVQRGPLCGANYCRNLLDFFDAVIDPDGKVLVGYQDGCVGGCITGGISQYSDQAYIARQSGGRPLYAAKDPVEPSKAGAPLLTGYRTADFAYLEWPTPDTGGAAITGYKVYRGTASGTLTFLSDVGKGGKFVDKAVPAGTAFYRVTASNAMGESAMGNELMLAVGDNVFPQEMGCTLPGIQIATDATGEFEAIAPAFRDISEMYIAEPEDMPGKIVVSTRISQAAPQQGGNDFYLWFDSSTQKDRTWRGRIGPDAMPLQFWDGRLMLTDDQMDQTRSYTAAGTLEAGSGITADGFVRFVLDKAKLGLATGDQMLSVNGRSLPFTRTNNILTEEAGYFDYKLVGNDFCAKGGIVLPPVTEPAPGSGPVVPPGSPPVIGAPGSGSGSSAGRFGGGAMGLVLLPLLGAAVWRRRKSQR